jgi:ABC-type phosphate transport system substrate-binding protein
MRSRHLLSAHKLWALVVGAFILALPSRVPANSGRAIALVVHPSSSISNLSMADVRNIFLGQKKTWSNGDPIVPIYLVPTSEVSAAFAKEALGKSLDELEKYWIDARIRGGLKKPRTVPSPATARKLVGSLSAAIAYMPLGEVDASVRVLAIEGVDPRSGGYKLKF